MNKAIGALTVIAAVILLNMGNIQVALPCILLISLKPRISHPYPRLLSRESSRTRKFVRPVRFVLLITVLLKFIPSLSLQM